MQMTYAEYLYFPSFYATNNTFFINTITLAFTFSKSINISLKHACTITLAVISNNVSSMKYVDSVVNCFFFNNHSVKQACKTMALHHTCKPIIKPYSNNGDQFVHWLFVTLFYQLRVLTLHVYFKINLIYSLFDQQRF